MSNRTNLQALLESILGSNHVYYQPPANIQMQYPAIRYGLSNMFTLDADDETYHQRRVYEITLISKTPDHPAIDSLVALPYCQYNRHYVSDNLYHDVFTIYY